MTRRAIVLVLVTAVLAAILAASAPSAFAVTFVDKQAQAGALLVQKYVNDYGQSNLFVFPSASKVRKGRLPGSELIWPSNPWTGKVMAPGTARGSYTYTLVRSGSGYRIVVHLSSGNWVLTGGVPAWFKPERDTASKQNALLLQRYIETYAAAHGGTYPAPTVVTAEGFGATYVWPKNPWTGAAMTDGDTVGCYHYTGGGNSYALKAMLTTGWSTSLGPLPLLSALFTSPSR